MSNIYPKPKLPGFEDEIGFYNSDVEKSALRVIEGATWKKQRVVQIMPAGKNMPTRVAFSLMSLIFPPNQPVFRIPAIGLEVGEAYTRAFEAVADHPDIRNWEYILTTEHDNLPPNDGLLKLIERMDKHPELSAIGGLYWCKGEGAPPQIWGDPNDVPLNFRPQPPRPGQLVECCGLGMGFTLFRMSMFTSGKIERPWFVTMKSKEGVGTQDLSFWNKARAAGFRCGVDCAVLVGHLDPETNMVW